MTPSPAPVYPPDMPLAALRTPELLLTTTLRLFAEAWRGRRGLVLDGQTPSWHRGLLAAGLPKWSMGSFDGLMGTVAMAGRRLLEVHCPHCAMLSGDEGRLLQIVSLFQHDRPHIAETVLDLWLAPEARELAVAPAGILAGAMSERGLIVPWRHAEAARPSLGLHGCDQGLALVQ